MSDSACDATASSTLSSTSYYLPLATAAITAGLSAAIGSMATAFIMRRRRRRRPRWDDDDYDGVKEHNKGASSSAKAKQQSDNNEAPSHPSHVHDSLDTSMLTCSSLSQDYPWLTSQRENSPPDTNHDNNVSDDNIDQVSSLWEVSRGMSQRHYSAVHSLPPACGGEEQTTTNATSLPCQCSCPACESCFARMSIDEDNRTGGGDFRPASVIRRRGSFQSVRRPSYGSLLLDDSMRSSLGSEAGYNGGDGNVRHSRGSSDIPMIMTTPASERRLSSDDGCINSSISRANFREEENYISETEMKFKGEEGFEGTVLSVERDLSETSRLLRRTRAISALSNRLMAAPDEATCIEEVTRLLVLMFGVERVSFAMLTGSNHFLLKRVSVTRKTEDLKSSSKSAFELEYLDSDYKRPLEGTAAGECAKTLKENYTPRTRDSHFDTHRIFYRNGVNTVLISPILVSGNKCAGCILLTRKAEDGYKNQDRALVFDIGVLLGANIYAKRLMKEADESKKRSREMLHSFIPPKVLAKIECYWDVNSEEYKSRKSTSLSSESVDSNLSSGNITTGRNNNNRDRSNSWYIANAEWTDDDNVKVKSERTIIKEKIQLLKNMNRGPEDNNVGVIVSTLGMDDFSPTTRALYAENVKNVCIVFTDIVGFSRMSMDIKPIQVMDMLQNLFERFDELCDVHGVQKLETIGDAYICATNLMEDEVDEDSVQDAAIRALAMAKDMVIEATNVKIPHPESGPHVPWTSLETLQIRVGIHVGDVTCGVLGQRLPKFTTCGKAVNMAARMEQTSKSSCIRVTKDFHDVVGDAEDGWNEKEIIPLKNMGEVETYLLEPIENPN